MDAIPPDILTKFHKAGWYTAQDVLDEGVPGCESLDIPEGDIVALGEIFDHHGFNRIS
jgi:hypothetical protein